MKFEVTFSGTAEEWAAERERTVCLAQPSPHSTARCEMPKGHHYEDANGNFHGGRTRGGYWKFWPVEGES